MTDPFDLEVGFPPRRDAATPPPPPATTAGGGGGGWGLRLLQRGLYFLAALLCTGMLLGHLNPHVPAFERAPVWPWDLFIRDGRFIFAWEPTRLFALATGAFALVFLLAAFLPGGRLRGAGVLVALALAFSAYLQSSLPAQTPPLLFFYVAGPSLGLAMGAVLLREGRRRVGGGGRGVLVAGLILLLGQLFFPLTPPPTRADTWAPETWRSQGGDAAQRLADRQPRYLPPWTYEDRIDPEARQPPAATVWDELRNTDTVFALCLGLGALLVLLSLLGLGAVAPLRVALVSVAVGVVLGFTLLPLWLFFLEGPHVAFDERWFAGASKGEAGVGWAVRSMSYTWSPFVPALAAAIADFAGPSRRG